MRRRRRWLTYQSGFEAEIEGGQPAALSPPSAASHNPERTAGSQANHRYRGDCSMVKTGGVGINDLLWPLAILSITTACRRSGGGYMKQVESELKERQLVLLRQTLFRGYWRNGCCICRAGFPKRAVMPFQPN